jgi:NAD(P)-dependent dehydrogenase (short-subunit alcohol dehydrogenase family)
VKAVAIGLDVHHEWSVQRAVEDAATALEGIDILVNNAGRFETEALERIKIEQWDEMFATNTRGPFLVAKYAYPHLKRRRGRIINIGSLGGLHPWPTHAHYSTSKAALHMLSQTMAKAWAPEISVNCVAPGMIVTTGEPSAGYEHFAAKTPMKRNGTVEDVAAAVMFFATGPHFITGQILTVDGGLGL